MNQWTLDRQTKYHFYCSFLLLRPAFGRNMPLRVVKNCAVGLGRVSQNGLRIVRRTMRKALLLLLPFVTRQAGAIQNSNRAGVPLELRNLLGRDVLPSRLRPAFATPFHAPQTRKFACATNVLRGGGVDKSTILRSAYNSQQ